MTSFSLSTAFRPAIHFLKRLTTIQEPEAKLTVGLDVGSTSIKVVALGFRKGSGLRPIVGKHLLLLENGQEGEVSTSIKTTIETLHLPVKTINLSVSGSWVIMRLVEMPILKPAELKKALPFEAQRYVPFNIQDVILDGVVLGPSEANKMWVLLVAGKKELIERRVDWVRRAGLEVGLIDIDAMAVTNAVLSQMNGTPPQATQALINIGAQLTNLVILKGEIPYLVRDIPWGGEKLIRSVSEQVGQEIGLVKEGLATESVHQEFLEPTKLATENLVTELQLSFDYFENRFGQPPESILLTGGMSQSATFVTALKSHLATQSVNSWAATKELSPQFTVAYGLALRTE